MADYTERDLTFDQGFAVVRLAGGDTLTITGEDEPVAGPAVVGVAWNGRDYRIRWVEP